jgi:hypothetical protein
MRPTSVNTASTEALLSQRAALLRGREREKPKKAKGCVHERDKGPNL